MNAHSWPRLRLLRHLDGGPLGFGESPQIGNLGILRIDRGLDGLELILLTRVSALGIFKGELERGNVTFTGA